MGQRTARTERNGDAERIALVSAVFKTPWGWIGILASRRGIKAIVLPRRSRRAVEGELLNSLPERNGRGDVPPRSKSNSYGHHEARTHAKQAQNQVLRFLSGTRRDLDFPVDLSGTSSFQRRVWKVAQRIPYGRARSYGWVAIRVGGARYARAVGHVLGTNPVPLIIPCHRVLAHDGSLGGFAGGLPTKRRLWALEGTFGQLGCKA